jgi:hypothetical protein
MTDLVWFELFLPRKLDLDALTDLTRPLANRTPSGILGRTPSVVFETWLAPGQVRWLVGLDPRLARSVPRQLSAHLPGLRLIAVAVPPRPQPLLSIMLSELRHQPTVTVYVDAPLEVRLQRLAARTHHLHEHRAREVSTDDLDVFAARERVMRQLIEAQPNRFITVDNSDRPLHDGVGDIVALVQARREGRS